MAVIIDMDMPKGCWGCKCMRTKDPETDYCILSGSEFDDRLDLLTNRQKDCPLKSADEMIVEIREYAYDEPEGYVCFCDREPDKIVSLEDVEDIIHKYCDKEKKDGSNND